MTTSNKLYSDQVKTTGTQELQIHINIDEPNFKFFLSQLVSDNVNVVDNTDLLAGLKAAVLSSEGVFSLVALAQTKTIKSYYNSVEPDGFCWYLCQATFGLLRMKQKDADSDLLSLRNSVKDRLQFLEFYKETLLKLLPSADKNQFTQSNPSDSDELFLNSRMLCDRVAMVIEIVQESLVADKKSGASQIKEGKNILRLSNSYWGGLGDIFNKCIFYIMYLLY